MRERFRDLVAIQIVAFPQSGVLRSRARRADGGGHRRGADLFGGLDPVGIDGDPDGHLDAIFAIAERLGVGIDIHLHDGGESGSPSSGDRRTHEAAGLQGRVAVSHAFALGSVPTDWQSAPPTARRGRRRDHEPWPGRRAMPPLKLLRGHGVEVFAGSDNIRDAWSPFGNGDMLERAMLIGYRANFRHDEDWRCLRHGPRPRRTCLASAPMASRSAPRPTSWSSTCGSLAEAVAERPRRKLVVKAGRIVARDGVLVP